MRERPSSNTHEGSQHNQRVNNTFDGVWCHPVTKQQVSEQQQGSLLTLEGITNQSKRRLGDLVINSQS